MAKLNEARRLAVMEQIPPRQCSARSKQSGERCRRFSMIGAGVCWMHGGNAAQTREKAEERISFAEALKARPRRSSGDVLADVLHTADTLYEQAKELSGAMPLTVEQADALATALGRAAHLGKLVRDTGVEEQHAKITEEQGAHLVAVMERSMDGLPLAIAETLRSRLGAALRNLDDDGSRPLPSWPVWPCPEPPPQLALEAAPVESPVGPSGWVPSPSGWFGRGRGSSACTGADGASGEDPRGPVQAVAEVVRSVPRWPLCPGCRRQQDPSHDQQCGYVAASGRGLFGGGR
jgi:hypothetical protein